MIKSLLLTKIDRKTYSHITGIPEHVISNYEVRQEPLTNIKAMQMYFKHNRQTMLTYQDILDLSSNINQLDKCDILSQYDTSECIKRCLITLISFYKKTASYTFFEINEAFIKSIFILISQIKQQREPFNKNIEQIGLSSQFSINKHYDYLTTTHSDLLYHLDIISHTVNDEIDNLEKIIYCYMMYDQNITSSFDLIYQLFKSDIFRYDSFEQVDLKSFIYTIKRLYQDTFELYIYQLSYECVVTI